MTTETSHSLEQLQHARDAAVLALEAAEANAARKTIEGAKTLNVLEAWGDLVDPLQWLKDDPSFGRGIAPISQLGDRGGGRFRPIVETEQDLAVIRGTGRLLAESVPVAIGVLKNLTNYIIGTGFSYKAVLRGESGTQQNDRLRSAVEGVIDEFIEENSWVGDLERELFIRSRRDGEFFLALYPQPMGHIQARVIEPEQVTEPADPRGLEDWLMTDFPSSWTFGVHSDAADVQSVHGYHVRWNETGSDWDYLAAETVEHVKLNVDRNVKRGVSDLYAVRSHLEGAEKLLRNTREGAAVQAAIAFIREHVPGTTPAQIQSLSSLAAVSQYTQQTQLGSRTRYISKYEPGTVLDVTGGMQYKPGPLGSSHGPNFIAIEQAVLRTIGTRWCMPEYMVSGDASNANYASTMVAESPFVKACEAEQRFYRSRFARVIWKVLKIAAEAGRFSREAADFETLRQAVEIKIDVPAVAVRDQLADARTREIQHRHGVLSKHTWAAEAGRDYATERRNLESE